MVGIAGVRKAVAWVGAGPAGTLTNVPGRKTAGRGTSAGKTVGMPFDQPK
ncbi:hypothetical protein STRTUCAR8_09435 [Streptomyces turgidiscabies Car8]|uniref:Uncharacterized protein n=1 Tax=Streptomyces turgidiscabies (strain Car8) TaxID=698760 RepID=L7EZJ5_STRT8|nr:hypothetical protein STRTUCAR8_09435 [Streptomyces turgidiscabies Car8]